MSIESFLHLHDILEEDLKAYFSTTSASADEQAGAPNGRISTKLRLSAAIRFFAGGGASDRNAVALDELDCPAPLLGGGHHWKDVEGGRKPERDGGDTPMRAMLRQVKEKCLLRPPVRERGGR